MHIPSFLLWSLAVPSLLVSDAAATPVSRGQNAKLGNANHIFNAIHSSMRQWGSSLNHNGMSFFMATVPAGTQLYHGSSSRETVRGTEWLAFEPEHSLVFARPRRPPGGKHPGRRPGNEGEEWEELLRDRRYGEEMNRDAGTDPWSRQGHAHVPPPPHMRRPPYSSLEHPLGLPSPSSYRGHPESHSFSNQRLEHHSFDGPPPSSRNAGKGYLHTYVPTRALRLLYVDGLSAGKTSNGTLDSQDMLLLNMTIPPGSPMGGEFARARGMCSLASTQWGNKIDGILRMEAGFEIILCNFEDAVERRNVVVVNDGETNDTRGSADRSSKEIGGILGGWQYIKAVSERFHGIGGQRVALDYDNFVTVFAYDDEDERGLGLWDNDVISDTPHPRLTNATPEQLGKVRDAVTAMVLQSGVIGAGRDWQAVADMVVQRYAGAIHHLHSDASVRRSKDAYVSYLFRLLRPFISPSARDPPLEIQRCVAQFIPPLPLSPDSSASLAHTTVHTVTSHICSTLLNALDASSLTLSRPLAATSSPPYRALDLIDGLFDYLQWTIWKECGLCADEEVCFIPIWPMGSLENHKNPRCVKEDGVGHGYWGWNGPPPGEERPHHQQQQQQRLVPPEPSTDVHSDGPSSPYSATGRWNRHRTPQRYGASPRQSYSHTLAGLFRGVQNRLRGLTCKR